MPLMQPPQSSGTPPNQPPVQPAPGGPTAALNTPPANVGDSEPDMSPTDDSSNQPNNGTQAIQQRLDALSNQDKQFLSQYLTPEFVYAIGLVSGPDAAQYLGQFTDPNKVLVPVSRQEAARIQDAVKQQGSQQPQGQPQQPAPQQGAPAMKPQAMPQPAQQQLPNGVTPAPMQHGIMAPQG